MQTHVLTEHGTGFDGLKVPEHGRGGGSFINDCFHVLGKPRSNGGVFEYNVRCVKRPGAGAGGQDRFVFQAIKPIAAGDELFYNYKNRSSE